jgi:hypothetical protein
VPEHKVRKLVPHNDIKAFTHEHHRKCKANTIIRRTGRDIRPQFSVRHHAVEETYDPGHDADVQHNVIVSVAHGESSIRLVFAKENIGHLEK